MVRVVFDTYFESTLSNSQTLRDGSEKEGSQLSHKDEDLSTEEVQEEKFPLVLAEIGDNPSEPALDASTPVLDLEVSTLGCRDEVFQIESSSWLGKRKKGEERKCIFVGGSKKEKGGELTENTIGNLASPTLPSSSDHVPIPHSPIFTGSRTNSNPFGGVGNRIPFICEPIVAMYILFSVVPNDELSGLKVHSFCLQSTTYIKALNVKGKELFKRETANNFADGFKNFQRQVEKLFFELDFDSILPVFPDEREKEKYVEMSAKEKTELLTIETIELPREE
ncbi:unnamed protein product [Ilex paraguariensis]|uniref:Uncharacterized protein n=1 Tax=Ilex paraguariensis TaxID=185542 RepID=A0ABC8SHC1_9AQUA